MYAVLAFLVTAAVMGTRSDTTTPELNRTVLFIVALLLALALMSRRVL